MIAIAAGAAFVGLFALWVIVPRFFIRRKQNAARPTTPLSANDAVAQAAD